MSDTKVVMRENKHYKKIDLEPVIYRTTALSLTAEIALRILEKFAIVTAEPDGEDSVGRQKSKLMDPQHVVDRSFELAEAFMHQAEPGNYLVDVPDPVFDIAIPKDLED